MNATFGESWRSIGRRVPPHWLMGTEVAERTTPYRVRARTQVVALARTRYARVNHTHLTELLAEREEIVLGRSTVRRILVGAGMASPRRRRPPLHRVRRQRMSQEGMLVQVDGSVHTWLEERGPRCTLLLAIDDATSTVPYALFRHEEDTHGLFPPHARADPAFVGFLWPCTVTATPSSSMYLARINRPAPTQFGRAMAELGVEQIFARSPEAKGRVERANGTFQDRLVTELRLAGARTISEANQVLWAFLTRFNKRFGVPPAQSTNAYRSPDPGLNLAGILCFKHSPQGGQRQHSQVQLAYPPTASFGANGPLTLERTWWSRSDWTAS